MPPDDMVADRLPPQNRDAERSVLGSMLRDNGIIGDVVQIVRYDNFYSDAHQKIFQAIVALYDKAHPADLVTLADYLKEQKQIEDIGGYPYLAELWDAAPTAANAEYYARIVRDKAIVRNLIHAGSEILCDAYDQTQPADELLGAAENKIFEIASLGVTGQTYTLEQALAEAYDRIDKRSTGDTATSGVATGFVDLDEKTAGLHEGELVILAARPSVGKTALALNLAQHVAVEPARKQPVAIFSLEMSSESLLTRMICASARVDQQKFRASYLNQDERRRLAKAASDIVQAPLFIDDTAGTHLMDIHAKLRRLKSEHGLSLV